MKPFEQALVDDCAKKCAFEIYKTMRHFKGMGKADKLLIKREIEAAINQYVQELENANRN